MKEENTLIKELEEKIEYIQADIDLLCDFVNRANNEKNTTIELSHLVGISLIVDGEVVDCSIVDSRSYENYSIDGLINDLMTKKRLMQIDLNQLKIEDDEDDKNECIDCPFNNTDCPGGMYCTNAY